MSNQIIMKGVSGLLITSMALSQSIVFAEQIDTQEKVEEKCYLLNFGIQNDSLNVEFDPQLVTMDNFESLLVKNGENELLIAEYEPSMSFEDFGDMVEITLTLKDGVSQTFTHYAHEHVYEKNEISPTCMAEGIAYYKCVDECDALKTEVLEKVDHSLKETTVVDPTCAKQGTISYKCEFGCGHGKVEVLPRREHVLKHSETVASTCSAFGYELYACENCTFTKKNTIQKKEHSYKYVKTTKGNCKDYGYKIYKCQKCSAEKRTYDSPKVHNFKYSKTVKATCTQNGYKLHKCTKCDATKKVYVAGYNHSYKLKKHVKATYKKAGYKSYKCSKCGKTKKDTLKKLNTGYVGTLKIKSLGVSVKAYDSSLTNPRIGAQKLCDRKNSAAAFDYGTQYVIADHKHQGFSKIKKAVPGKTTCTFKGKTYKCWKKFNGKNTGTHLTTTAGKKITNMNKNGLTMYTCNQNWRNVTIVFWKRV